MINIVYDSKTGNVERFINKLKQHVDWNFTKISKGLKTNEPFHLITFTTGIGHVPNSTAAFLNDNAAVLLSITSSGNMNWGDNFGLAADKISIQYNTKIIHKFELSGTLKDINTFITSIKNYSIHGK